MAKQEAINVIDPTGKPTVVYRISSDIPSGTMDDPSATLEGLAEHRLADGTPLNVVEGGFSVPGRDGVYRRV